MADLSDMSFDKFRLWTDSSLKAFLALRKKSTEGTIDELVTRAFITWEEKVPVNSETEHQERKLLEEYKAKLKVDRQILPDPFSLDEGWIGQDNGMKKWPSVYITDIAAYLNDNTPQELVNKVINEYKVGKAYRYYSCDWVKEVKYHSFRDSSPLCLLKAQVTPSMSLRAHRYQVWAVITKSSGDVADGQILSAYCTCTAGMLGTCNHIAELLFRVETAVVNGRTEKSCTEILCAWNVPKQRTPLKPLVATNISWSKDHYSKRGSTPSNTDCVKSRAAFTPLSGRQVQLVKDKDEMRKKLSAIASRCAPDARFHKMMLKEPPVPPPVCPPSIPASVESYKATYTDYDSDQFRKDLVFSEAQCLQVKSATIDQGTQLWKDQRKARVTASNFYRVSTRMNTLDKDPTADPTPLVTHIMGYKECEPTGPMKHGIACEPHAKTRYSKQMRKVHRRFKCSNSGITILADKPYISASADLEVECDCCGKGLCEIKCPSTIKGQKPTVEHVHFLDFVNGEICVKKNDQYYAQIQGQMAILNRTYCDLYVFSFHGDLCTRVEFDRTYWQEMLTRLDKFWIKYVLPELFTQRIKSSLDGVSSVPSVPSTSTCGQCIDSLPTKISSKRKKCEQPKGRKRVKRQLKMIINMCPVCGEDCVDDPSVSHDQSIQCSVCTMWCHFQCGGVDDDSVPDDSEQWLCPKCH